MLESGKSVAEHTRARKPAVKNPLIKIGLCFSDRGQLHSRIEQRFDLMLEAGLKAEVEALLDRGVAADASSMRMIGYRQMLEHLNKINSHQEMRLKGIAATRQLAKRQLTWLRNQRNLIWWVDSGLKNGDFGQLVALIGQFVR